MLELEGARRQHDVDIVDPAKATNEAQQDAETRGPQIKASRERVQLIEDEQDRLEACQALQQVAGRCIKRQMLLQLFLGGNSRGGADRP